MRTRAAPCYKRRQAQAIGLNCGNSPFAALQARPGWRKPDEFLVLIRICKYVVRGAFCRVSLISPNWQQTPGCSPFLTPSDFMTAQRWLQFCRARWILHITFTAAAPGGCCWGSPTGMGLTPWGWSQTKVPCALYHASRLG